MDESTQRLIDALKKDAETWKQKYDDLCCDFEHVSAERDAERTNAEVWREKYEKLSGEMEQLGAEGYGKEIESNAIIKQLQDDVKGWEEEARRQDKYAAEWRKTAEKSEEQLKASEEQRQSAETALQRMKQRADILENAVASAKANGEGAFRECESMRQHNVELQNEITRLMNREKQLQAALAEICIQAFVGGDACE